jgi:hypothetical protein
LRSDRCPQRLPLTTVNDSSRERCRSRRTVRLSSPGSRRKSCDLPLYSGRVGSEAAHKPWPPAAGDCLKTHPRIRLAASCLA